MNFGDRMTAKPNKFLSIPLQFCINKVFFFKLSAMKYLKTRARLILCILIIAAFFIPSYNNVSAYGFIKLAFLETKDHSEVTSTDVLITIVPLLLVPLSALVIVIRTAVHLPTRKTYLGLPLIFLIFFFVILLPGGSTISGKFSDPKVLLEMQAGFYLAATAAVLLLFTRSFKRKRQRRTVAVSETIVAAGGI